MRFCEHTLRVGQLVHTGTTSNINRLNGTVRIYVLVYHTTNVTATITYKNRTHGRVPDERGMLK